MGKPLTKLIRNKISENDHKHQSNCNLPNNKKDRNNYQQVNNCFLDLNKNYDSHSIHSYTIRAIDDKYLLSNMDARTDFEDIDSVTKLSNYDETLASDRSLTNATGRKHVKIENILPDDKTAVTSLVSNEEKQCTLNSPIQKRKIKSRNLVTKPDEEMADVNYDNHAAKPSPTLGLNMTGRQFYYNTLKKLKTVSTDKVEIEYNVSKDLQKPTIKSKESNVKKCEDEIKKYSPDMNDPVISTYQSSFPYVHKVWINATAKDISAFQNPLDRRVASISRFSCCKITLMPYKRRQMGLLKRLLVIEANNYEAILKCCSLLDDKFAHFYTSSNLNRLQEKSYVKKATNCRPTSPINLSKGKSSVKNVNGISNVDSNSSNKTKNNNRVHRMFHTPSYDV